MNKKSIISILILLPLIASCRGTPIQYERAKEIKDAIKVKLSEEDYTPDVKLFTKKYYSVDGTTEVTRQEIYDREKMFHSRYEIVGGAGKSVSEYFYYRLDDPEKGLYIVDAMKIDGNWEKGKVEKTHYNTEVELKEAWTKYHNEKIIPSILLDSKNCLNKMEEVFNYADGDEVSVNVTCMSENYESLSMESRFNLTSVVSGTDVVNTHTYKLYLKDYIIASDERHTDASHNSSLGYNYSKAIINLPKLPS